VKVFFIAYHLTVITHSSFCSFSNLSSNAFLFITFYHLYYRWMNRLGLAAIGYTPDDKVPRPDEGEMERLDQK